MKTLLLACLCLVLAVPVFAQGTITVGSQIGSGVVGSTSGSGYDDGGRRDPFVSLVVAKRVTAPPPPPRALVGLAALAITDVAVTGISKMGGSFVAILRSPDGRSFMGHCGDRLQNGTVKSIDAESVVFVEQAADAMGVIRPHDVRKALHQTGEDR